MVRSSTINKASSPVLLSRSEEEFIREGCREGCRLDGRTRTDFRTYSIVVSSTQQQQQTKSENDDTFPPPLVLSNGSARLISSSGDAQKTHILCSVKADIVHPSLRAPEEGVLELYVDRLTTATTATRKSDDELQALLRSLLLDQLIEDKRDLCIVPNEYVWRLSIDLYFLSALGGSLLDSASHVVRAALQHTLLPLVTPSPKTVSDEIKSDAVDDASGINVNKNASCDLLVNADICVAQPPPGAQNAPILTTVTAIPCRDPFSNRPTFVLIHDATAEEEACAEGQVHIAVLLPSSSSSSSDAPVLCGFQTLGGGGSLPLSLLPEITLSAIHAAQQAQNAYKVVTAPNNASSLASSQALFLQETYAMQ